MLDKSKIKQRFSKAVTTYDEHASIQKMIYVELAKTMQQFIPERSWNKVLEIGCGTGGFIQEVLKYAEVNTLYLNDLYEDNQVIQNIAHVQNLKINPLIGDIEQLELPHELDLVISSSAFQWMTDLSSLLQKIYQALKPQGYLVFSSFGTENFREIKKLTGQGLDYIEIHILQRMLMDVGFEFVTMKQEGHLVNFNHPREVLQHLKDTGVTATSSYRWTKSSLQKFYRDYEQFVRFPSSDQPAYPLTYSPIQCIVRKK